MSISQYRMRRRISKAHDLKVQIGSGAHPMPGWINIDGYFTADLKFDIRRPWPLGSGSVAYIFAEHVLDHLHFPDGIGFVLCECYRVLKPGGVMRAILHDAESLLRAYIEKDMEFFRQIGFLNGSDENTSSLIAFVNHIFRFNGFHQFIYDYETIERQFLKAGFSSVRRSSLRGSSIPELNMDLDIPDRSVQSMYIEWTR
jgi:predicted SAM-dependent methyltransferase